MPSPTTPVPWQRLYNDIKIAAAGVTDAVMQQELFRCFKDFLDQTNIWTEEVPIVVLPNVYSYPFTLEGKGTPSRLMLLYNPALMRPEKFWVPGGGSMQVPGVLALGFAPSTSETWNAVVAKNIIDPVDDQNYPDIDDEDYWIVDKYRDALYYGTLARLQVQVSKPYTNMPGARTNMQMYIMQRSKARTDVVKANTYGGQRWSFPQGYATTSRKGWM